MEFIDTHNHILPGIDDGSPDLETSIEMAKIAVEDGISTIVATPHIIEGIYEGADLDQRVATLQQELDSRNIDLRLVKGAEVPMSLCMSGDGPLLQRLSIGGKYLLIESADTNYEQVSRAVYQVRLLGLYPILAHPERTSYVHKSIESITSLASQGEVFFQVTAASIAGLFGTEVVKNCGMMAKRGLVHLIASDAHSTGKRAPRMSDSFKVIARHGGDELARAAVLTNPRLMLSGEKMITTDLAGAGLKQGILKRFHRKN